jgi:hypothetical protein
MRVITTGFPECIPSPIPCELEEKGLLVAAVSNVPNVIG